MTFALTAAVPPAAIAISATNARSSASAATRWKRAEGLWSLPVRESVEQSDLVSEATDYRKGEEDR
jgi:hypothetical protein